MTNPFYEVLETPLFIDHVRGAKKFEGKKVIWNRDTQEPVSIVGDGYKVIPFAEVNDLIETHLKNNGLSYQTNHRLGNDGRKLFSTYELMDKEFQFAPDNMPEDTSQGRIVTFNSYDSSSSFQATWGLFRAICSNGCVFGGSTSFNEKVWHTKNADHRDMIKRMFSNLDGFKQVKEFYNAMAEYELSQREGNNLISELVPDNRKTVVEERVKVITERPHVRDNLKHVLNEDGTLKEPYGKSVGIRRVDAVKNLWNKPIHLLPDAERPRNLWTLYNCFTNVVTHEVDSPNTQANLHKEVTRQFREVMEV